MYFPACYTRSYITGYQVHYNGIMMNVSSSSTTLTFDAPSIPDDEFTSTVVVMVIATSSYGIGPASNPKVAPISGKVIFD